VGYRGFVDGTAIGTNTFPPAMVGGIPPPRPGKIMLLKH
jgi:hypothetical protein